MRRHLPCLWFALFLAFGAYAETAASDTDSVTETERKLRIDCNLEKKSAACLELVEFYSAIKKFDQAAYYAQRACITGSAAGCDLHRNYLQAVIEKPATPPAPAAPLAVEPVNAAPPLPPGPKLNTFGALLGPVFPTSGGHTDFVSGLNLAFGVESETARSGGSFFSVGFNFFYLNDSVSDIEENIYIFDLELITRRIAGFFYLGGRFGVGVVTVSSPSLLGVGNDLAGSSLFVAPVIGVEIPVNHGLLGVDVSWMSLGSGTASNDTVSVDYDSAQAISVLGTIRFPF